MLVLGTAVAGQNGAQAATANRAAAAEKAHSEAADGGRSVMFFSGSRTKNKVGSISFSDEDVVGYDPVTGAYRLVIDGSQLGLNENVDALEALDDGSFLLSYDKPFQYKNLGTVEASDILRVVPASPEHPTASVELLLDGSDLGLTSVSEDIDSIAVTPDGRLVISTKGHLRVPKPPDAASKSSPGELAGRGEDLFVLNDAAFGSQTRGYLALYFDGTDAGLHRGTESVQSASIDPATGAIFYADRVPASDDDAAKDVVMQCSPQSLPPEQTRCETSVFQDLGLHNVDALHVGAPVHLSPGCLDPQRTLNVTSPSDGDVVDATEKGTGTGSFVLRGVAPPHTTSVKIALAGEDVTAEVTQGDCTTGWSKEVVVRKSGPIVITVTATTPRGVTTATVNLTLIAAGEDDLLVQPAFARTPQLHDRLVSFDPATGKLVFRGDVRDQLDPGDGLGGGSSAAAPNGYLRIVQTVEFDGANTVVTTRQAGLTEFIRQVDIDFRTEPGSVAPIVITADGSVAPAAHASAAKAAAKPKLAVGPKTDLAAELNIDPGVEFELDIRWSKPCWLCAAISPSLKRLWFEGSLELSANVELTHEVGKITTGEKPFGKRFDDYRLGGLTIPTPIGVPIIITFEAESQAFYELSISAGVRLQYGLGFKMAAGFEYNSDGTGRGTYRHGSFSGGPPDLSNVDLGIIAKAAVGLETDFEVLLYGQAGIEIEARPQIAFEAVGDLIKREINWDLKLVVPFDGNLEVEIRIGPVGWEREFGHLQFFSLSITLFKGKIGGEPAKDLAVTYTGPPGAFPGQVFDYTVRAKNTGSDAANGVTVRIVLPTVGSFVSSTPAGSPPAPAPGSTYTVALPTIPAGQTSTVVLHWRAPKPGDVTAESTATVTSTNRAGVGPLTAAVPVGLESNCNPCGATAAGTGLRNRSEGTVQVAGVPAGATVTRAVLVWGILYSGATPRNSITLNGTSVTADVASTVSGTLCWGDSATVGYAADVTRLVQGNGPYVVSDPPRGTTRVDSEPRGALPYTDGATLVVFYVGGGSSSQVLSDFTYNTNTAGPIVRSFADVVSHGFKAKLTMAGPDGQGDGGETFTITGAGSPIVLANTWNGSDPQQGPSFTIGNLWDTDTYDVTSVLPAGQKSLTFRHQISGDCDGIGASILEVAQVAP